MRAGFAVVTLAALLALSACDARREDTAAVRAPCHAHAVGNPNLDNAHQLTAKVFTGAQPYGDLSFAALQQLGVKTVISVDGAKPNLDAAAKYGLRYVHLPMGYDSVNEKTAVALAKAIQELPGPIYVHCHHGKHRGPAAAAVACVMAGELTNDEAVAAMKTLGTGENYKGLWQSARTARRADKKTLKQFKIEYRAVSPVPPLAEAMVEVEERLEHLTAAQKTGWHAPKDNPDIDPAHEALQLREIFVEITRTDDHMQRDAAYRKLMDDGIAAAQHVETALREYKSKSADAQALEAVNSAFLRVTQTCKSCHKSFRD